MSHENGAIVRSYIFLQKKIHFSNSKFQNTSSEPQGLASSNLTSTSSELISSDQLNTIYKYTYSITIPVCIFGLASNIVNIAVFYKMGLSSVSNICFFCLAITDFNCVTYILVVTFALHPGLKPHVFLPMAMLDAVLTSDTVYYAFSAMGSWITAIINMERSCCVVLPLKVGTIRRCRYSTTPYFKYSNLNENCVLKAMIPKGCTFRL